MLCKILESNDGVQMLAESWFHEALVVQLEFRDMRFKNRGGVDLSEWST